MNKRPTFLQAVRKPDIEEMHSIHDKKKVPVWYGILIIAYMALGIFLLWWGVPKLVKWMGW